MKKKLSVILCIVMAMSMMTGCTTFNNFRNAFFSDGASNNGQNGVSKTIKIGVYEPLTGEYKSFAEEEKVGIELAKEMYPQVLGKDVELIYADNQADMHVAETVINELVSQNPAVILGSYGETVTLVAGDAVKEAQIPAISITSTNPLITVNNPFYFRATIMETSQGEVLAAFAYEAQGKRKIATVRTEDDDIATTTVNRFNKKFRSLATEEGTGIVGNYQVKSDTTDYSETLKKIKDSGADAVYLYLSAAKADQFLKQANEAKLDNILYIGTKDWVDADFQKNVAERKLSIAYASDFSVAAHQTATSEKFVKAYKDKYGEDAEPTEAMVLAFDSYVMALKAIENAYSNIMSYDFDKMAEDGASEDDIKAAKAEWIKALELGAPNGDAIRHALTQLDGFEGASGLISFNGTNEAKKSIVVNYFIAGEAKEPYTGEVVENSSASVVDSSAESDENE